MVDSPLECGAFHSCVNFCQRVLRVHSIIYSEFVVRSSYIWAFLRCRFGCHTLWDLAVHPFLSQQTWQFSGDPFNSFRHTNIISSWYHLTPPFFIFHIASITYPPSTININKTDDTTIQPLEPLATIWFIEVHYSSHPINHIQYHHSAILSLYNSLVEILGWNLPFRPAPAAASWLRCSWPRCAVVHADPEGPVHCVACGRPRGDMEEGHWQSKTREKSWHDMLCPSKVGSLWKITILLAEMNYFYDHF